MCSWQPTAGALQHPQREEELSVDFQLHCVSTNACTAQHISCSFVREPLACALVAPAGKFHLDRQLSTTPNPPPASTLPHAMLGAGHPPNRAAGLHTSKSLGTVSNTTLCTCQGCRFLPGHFSYRNHGCWAGGRCKEVDRMLNPESTQQHTRCARCYLGLMHCTTAHTAQSTPWPPPSTAPLQTASQLQPC